MSRNDKDSRFQELYQRHYPAVVRFIQSFGFSREKAKELAQDTFVRVYRGMDEYRGGEWSFLETTARRIALNEIRRRETIMRKASETSLEALPFLPTSLANDPWMGAPPPSQEDALIVGEESKLLRRRLVAAIRDLPQPIRLCLLLRLRGRSYKEIQEHFNISMDQVKSRLYDARKRLRERLGEGVDLPGRRPEDDDD